MTREIKFRAWDGDKFVYWDVTQSHVIGYVVVNRLPIDQFTGLKDKKGVEIWEGDVVKCRQMQDLYDFTGVVHMVDDGYRMAWWLDTRNTTDGKKPYDVSGVGGAFVPFHDKGEVIGNIHENPELLEQTS